MITRHNPFMNNVLANFGQTIISRQFSTPKYLILSTCTEGEQRTPYRLRPT